MMFLCVYSVIACVEMIRDFVADGLEMTYKVVDVRASLRLITVLQSYSVPLAMEAVVYRLL